jgi:hypothetical protein
LWQQRQHRQNLQTIKKAAEAAFFNDADDAVAAERE